MGFVGVLVGYNSRENNFESAVSLSFCFEGGQSSILFISEEIWSLSLRNILIYGSAPSSHVLKNPLCLKKDFFPSSCYYTAFILLLYC